MTIELAKRNDLMRSLTFDHVFSHPQRSLRGVFGWDGVAKLGSKNIVELISNAFSKEQSLAENSVPLRKAQDILRGKSGTAIKELAKRFDNPVITEIGIPEGDWTKDLHPLDTASQDRERNTTTFNMCGWCKHSGGGSFRYNYAIRTTCSLLGNLSPETRFNTPCLLQSKTADEIRTHVQHLENEAIDLFARREKIFDGINLLTYLKDGAPEKPYLICLRPDNYFNIGDEVMVYIGQSVESKVGYRSKVKNGVWVPAIVVVGDHEHDGIVNYRTLFPIHTNTDYLDGCGGGAGKLRPEVILRSEFEYLRECAQNKTEDSLRFLTTWVDHISDDLNELNKLVFREHLATGAVASPPTS